LLDKSDEKTKYWINYRLYDITISSLFGQIKLPRLMELDKFKCCYLYLNNLETYHYIKSEFLDSNKIINNDKYNIHEDKTNNSLGLYFCGKIIEYNNENIICCPNSIICKKCREYNLKNKYLININGRVAKKSKCKDKVFHCFGHYLIGKNKYKLV